MSGPASTLFEISDQLTGEKFLVDTGASISLLATEASQLEATSPVCLTSVDGSKVISGNFEPRTIRFGNTDYGWKFLKAAVPRNILGADFLAGNALVVDMAAKSLVSPYWHSVSQLASIRTQQRVVVNATFSDRFARVLAEFPRLTVLSEFPAAIPVATHCEINTQGDPVFQRPRPLYGIKLQAMKAEFAALLKLGIVRRSRSPWASPLHVVPKSDGQFRPCGDYRRLNAITQPDRYPLPLLQDFASNLSGCQFFSKIDLVKGYHQIPVRPADIPKTAVTTPFGCFEYLRMPFGLRNAAQTFQRVVDIVTQGLAGVFVYIDDLLIASRSANEHERHLRALFKRLTRFNLVVNRDKSVLGSSELPFLGHVVSGDGIKPLPDSVDAIDRIQPPTTVKEVKSFIGSITFYHRFLPRLSEVLRPLHLLTAGPKTKRCRKILWGAEHQQAFERAKNLLKTATLLTHLASDSELRLVTDASDIAIGAVLEQADQTGWRPVAFFSRVLSAAELNYSTFDRELTAIYAAIQKFKHWLDGRQFHILTDHKPLVGAIAKTTDAISGRQQRQLSFIAEFTSDVRHLPGAENTVADFLSRPSRTGEQQGQDERQPAGEDTVSTLQLEATAASTDSLIDMGLDLDAVATAQRTDLEVLSLETNSSFPTFAYRLPSGNLLACTRREGWLQVLLPHSFRVPLIKMLHYISHPGVKATQNLVRRQAWWPKLGSDVSAFVLNCQSCLRSKVVRHVRAPLQPFEQADDRFSHIHVDLVGPLPDCRGSRYLFTMVDRFTRWFEAVPMDSISADACANAFALFWVARFGAPRIITSDLGRQFTSDIWRQMAQALGAELHYTTAYHPQANGMVERFHRRLKEALRARLEGHIDWPTHLPWVLMGLRATVVADTQASPAELVYGRPLTLPGIMVPRPYGEPGPDFVDSLRGQLPGNPGPPPTDHGTNRLIQVPDRLANCTHIYVLQEKSQAQHSLSVRYKGPYKVVRRAERTITHLDSYGLERTVSIDRVKPAPTTETALPPQLEEAEEPPLERLTARYRTRGAVRDHERERAVNLVSNTTPVRSYAEAVGFERAGKVVTMS